MITFDGAVKRFGGHVALDGLTVRIVRGEAVALLGPNGCGKTTTLKLAAGLLSPDAGTVLVGDPPRRAWDPEARVRLSFLPQRVSFPDALTGREVVEFYRRLRAVAPSRDAEVLRFASLNGAGDRPVATYSGGMLQRLGLAVAMLPDADALLLDEPTAALDPEGLCAFDALIRRWREAGRTVLFSSHQVGATEKLADRFLVLVGGRLAVELSQRELRDRLAERGFIRLRLDGRPRVLDDALCAHALSPQWSGDELTVQGAADTRALVLDAARAFGVGIRGLVAQDGELDAFYRELVGAAAHEPRGPA